MTENKTDRTSAVLNIVPKTKDIFLYKFSDAYANSKGICRFVASVGLLVAAILMRGSLGALATVLLVLLALFNSVVSPIGYLVSSVGLEKKLPSNIIAFSGTRFSVNDGKNRLERDWAELYQVISSKKLLLIYIAPKTAFIIPKDQMGGEREVVEALVKENSSLCHTVYRRFM